MTIVNCIVYRCSRAAETYLEERSLASQLPAWSKVVFTMVLVIGLFGGLLLLIHRLTAASLARTHAVVQALPLPTPVILVHAAVFGALFLLYAWVHGVGVKLW